MATEPGLLPHRPAVDEPDGGTRVVQLGSPEMTELCGALASENATLVLATLAEEPMTTSDVAERVDTSIQNAQYHVRKLCEAGLVEVVDIWYSSRGSEMKVYATAHERVVFTAEEPDETGESGGTCGDSVGEGSEEREPTLALAGRPS